MVNRPGYGSQIPKELHGNGRFFLPRKNFTPAYIRTYEHGRLKQKAEEAIGHLRSCNICPRDCKVDRLADRTATCKAGRYARVSSAFAHFGEEDCLRGRNGSGTIFFEWCNLRCVFCQNYETSQVGEGAEVSAAELARMMLEMQNAGCHNINLVTPEHVVPQILEALLLAVERGLHLPLVYNTSSYDSLESIRLMEGVVDIYMPDFKLWDPGRSLKYLMARDYPVAARRVIAAMHAQVRELCVDEEGIALRGVLVRHLVMPQLLDDTREIMNYLADAVSRDTYVNVMDQYRPAWKARSQGKFSEINRAITPDEYAQAVEYAQQAGLWRLDRRWRMVTPRNRILFAPN